MSIQGLKFAFRHEVCERADRAFSMKPRLQLVLALLASAVFVATPLAQAKSGVSNGHYTYDPSIIGIEPVSGTANANNQNNQPGGAP